MQTRKRQFDLTQIRHFTYPAPEAKQRCLLAAELRRQVGMSLPAQGIHSLIASLDEAPRALMNEVDFERLESCEVLSDAAQAWRLRFFREREKGMSPMQRNQARDLSMACAKLKGAVSYKRSKLRNEHEAPVQNAYNASAMERNVGGDWDGFCDDRR